MSDTNNPLQEAEHNINDLSKACHVETFDSHTKPLSALSRLLTDEDFKSVGVQKLLLGQLDEFDTCKKNLEQIKTKFHERDKEAEVLSQTLEGYKSFDWIYSGLLTVGSILIGFYASQPDKGVILLIIGIASVLFSFVIKYRRTK